MEERLREQQTVGIRMPEGMPLDEHALRVLIAAETGQVPRPSFRSRSAIRRSSPVTYYRPGLAARFWNRAVGGR